MTILLRHNTGLRELWTGQYVQTYTSQAIQWVAEEAGASSGTAHNIGEVGNGIIGFAGTLGAGIFNDAKAGSWALNGLRGLLGRMGLPAAKSEGLVHLASGDAGAFINESGVLKGNIYAGPLSNAGQSSLGVTLRTGFSPDAYEAAVRIPTAGKAAFSTVKPIGSITSLQWLTGQQYTANGILDLSTGAFTRTGVNWNQVFIYGTDAAITTGGSY